ncbi:hypothetical protein ACFLUT_02970 [Chloroflexota bacterium]
MRRLLVLLVVVFMVLATAGTALAANERGPAPNSHDGIPDGSGFEDDFEPFGSADDGMVGPAPNSGDGIPDGSGF